MKSSRVVPDWSRESVGLFAWDPGRKLVRSIRAHQRWSRSRAPWALVLRKIARIRYLWWSTVSGADIPITCRIGGGFRIPHPQGVVVHSKTTIGINCMLLSGVVIGETHTGFPAIYDDVFIGAGAKIIGGVCVGSGSQVGAGAVVVRDVLAYVTVVGNPARIVRSRMP